MAGKRLRPRKNKAEAEAAILAARRLERPGWSMGRSVMHGEGHIRLDDRRGTARRLCQHTARHRQPQAPCPKAKKNSHNQSSHAWNTQDTSQCRYTNQIPDLHIYKYKDSF